MKWLNRNKNGVDNKGVSESEVKRRVEEAYADGRKWGKTEGFESGKDAGMAEGIKIGQERMKDRYIEFMKETLLMVQNDEMELVEKI